MNSDKQSNFMGIILSILIGLAVITGSGFYIVSQQSTNNTTGSNPSSVQNLGSQVQNSTVTNANLSSTTTQNSGTQSATQQSASSQASTNTNACIITISGQKYDVTQLQTTHSGGNVFECGKDNTSIFFSQHNQRWLDTRMPQYKV